MKFGRKKVCGHSLVVGGTALVEGVAFGDKGDREIEGLCLCVFVCE